MSVGDSSPHPVSETFIVRCWPEWRDEPGGESEWRGEVIRVRGERRVYFRTLAGLEDAFRRLLEHDA
jgi:hypothetical protein